MELKQKLLGLIFALTQAKEEADESFPPGEGHSGRNQILEENYGTFVFWAIGRFREEFPPSQVLEMVHDFFQNKARPGFYSDEKEDFRELARQFTEFAQDAHRDTEP